MKKIIIYCLFSLESIFVLGIYYLWLLMGTISLADELATYSNIITGIAWVVFVVTNILLIRELFKKDINKE